ncbi:MAG: CgeB family protein [Terriglobales bacterium]
MRLAYFAHSWLSDWNHGNAHFLRGLARALHRRGHQVRLYEPMPGGHPGWSLGHLLAEPAGPASVQQMRAAFPELDIRLYGPHPPQLESPPPLHGLPWVEHWEQELRGVDVVLVHEWNEVEQFAWLLRQRRRYGFRLLLHDTHHRAWSEPAMLDRLPLAELDGVIAFGESLRRLYAVHGRARRTYTLQEAADIGHFRPLPSIPSTHDVVWVGNWGDDERTGELDEYLFAPAAQTRARTCVYGVRYPPAARARLAAAAISYGGYLANLEVPAAFARARVSVHVPRAPYARNLPGIPTIRVFEALACGVALLSAPWADSEQLFQAGDDYWPARDGREMTALLRQLLSHPEQRILLGRHAVASIAALHTCAHRAQTLEAICHDLD